ncbi:MAG: DUF4166 domain-containing protein [Pseudomonas sp.]|uniref:DUF4166 domain-containing protein n=1 Tax=Pseudomonas sp. TaxID=306 RepID=UPI002732ACB9|nr:DUF4166 domain-containing protein [Pseudomonas sp.]MDP3845606.1 DUF4166 domain-containing protein [Pseudomonas sp.]
MKSLMQQLLGNDWDKLHPALQAHYQFAPNMDIGHLDIEYPRFMQPILHLLYWCGALINRAGKKVDTRVEKHISAERQYWRRAMTFADGQVIQFNSYCILAGGNQLIEFVNPFLGLQMAVHVQDGQLHYQGVRFVMKLGSVRLPIPEWLALGHTSIIETGMDNNYFAMDFRLTHPLFGQVFRYSGVLQNIRQ